MTTSESSIQRFELVDPDVRLMLRVRDGDAAAFEELVLRYQDRLLNILEHLVGSRHQAEDLAQEVFLRIYRARNRYLPGARFSTWLFTIANNIASNQRRSQSRRREVQVAAAESGSVGLPGLEGMALAKSGLLPARQLDKAEMRDVIRSALETLSERQRMAVLLNKFEGMTYVEIADTMEMSPQAIKSLLSRARVNLKEVLEPYLQLGERPNGSQPR